MSDVFSVDLDGAPFARVVVKCFRPDDDTAAIEWECLEFVQRVAVPVPSGVALDPDGRWFGRPAIAMTYVPGRADVSPRDLNAWLRHQASALATIHATPIDGASGALLRPTEVETWERTSWNPGPLVARATDALERHLPRRGWPPVLIHGDLHPGQMLWQRGAVSGIVDWGDLQIGPRWYEVAYFRTDVVLICGMRAADRVVEHYVEITGLEPVDLPVFDLMCALHAREWGHLFLGAYQQQGRTDTMRQFAARLSPFLRRALAQVGA